MGEHRVELIATAHDPKTPDGQRRRLQQLAENIKQTLTQSQGQSSERQTWMRIAQADQAEAVLQALSSGEAIPDQQWNKLLSSLDDGLWQVRGKQPPEVYRKAIEQYQDQIRELMQTIDEG